MANGNWSGGGDFYRVVCNISVIETDETRGYHLQANRYLQASGYHASYATHIYCSWLGYNVDVTGDGNYGSSNTDLGWFPAGNKASHYIEATYTTGGGTYYKSSVTATYTGAYGTPETVSNITATRVSDTQNTVTWENNSGLVSPYGKILIERSVNGGNYAQVASLNYTAATTSYTDNSTAANKYYKYRARVQSPDTTKYSAYSAVTSTVYNTPAAPSNLAGTYATGSGSVNLTWTNNAETQSAFTLESSSDGSTWTTVSSSISASATSYTDSNPPLGTAAYRIKATRGALASAYSNIASVITLTEPNPPALVSPAQNITLNKPSSVVLEWQHLPKDGTAQTAATVAVSTNGTTFTEHVISGSASTYTLNTSSYSAGTTVYWKVKTKGAYASYGEYSSVYSFKIEQAPTVSITSPASTVTNSPVVVAFTYSEPNGSQKSANISIATGGEIKYQQNIGTATSYSIEASEWLPDNGKTYTVTVSVESTTSLTKTVSKNFTTSYSGAPSPTATATYDEEVASVEIQVTPSTSGTPTDHCGVWRVDADGETLIIDNFAGGSVIDPTPPLDQEITYRCVAFTSAGIPSQTLVNITVPSGGYAYFNWDKVARVGMDLNWSTSIEHDRTLYRVVGRRDPVSRHSSKRTKTISANGTVWWDSDQPFEELQDFAGTVIFREPRGHVIPVALSIKLDYPVGQPLTQASISMTQVSA